VGDELHRPSLASTVPSDPSSFAMRRKIPLPAWARRELAKRVRAFPSRALAAAACNVSTGILSEILSGTRTEDAIEDAHCVLVDLTHRSTATGEEIGWARARGKPVLFLQPKGAPSYAYLSGDREYPYDATWPGIVAFMDEIEAAVRKIMGATSDPPGKATRTPAPEPRRLDLSQ
jgi:hypothetical protein